MSGRYALQNKLGEGGHGVTYKGFDKITNSSVAVKVVDISKIKQDSELMREIMDEVNIARYLGKSGCNRYMACLLDNFQGKFKGINSLFIVSEFVPGLTLHDFLNSNPGVLNSHFLWSVFLQLILGLKFIHDKGVAHRDIKLTNILITPKSQIKYIDFGISCNRRCDESFCTDFCQDKGSGTTLYMAPEDFTSGMGNTALAMARDVWSLSVVMYQLCNQKRYPFNLRDQNGNYLSPEGVAKNIVSQSFPSNYSGDDGRTNEFMKQLLEYGKPISKRSKIDQLLAYQVEEIMAKPASDDVRGIVF